MAAALREWLPDVLQHATIWMSEHDIDAGSRWTDTLSERLDGSNFGVLCLTHDNQDSPWLLFEAGALGKTARVAKVVPYLIDVSPADVRFPLAQFQGVPANRDGTLKLVRSINEAAEQGVPRERLDRHFQKWWPDLERHLRAADTHEAPTSPARSDREILEELLSLARGFWQGQFEPTLEAFEDYPTGYVWIDVGEFSGAHPHFDKLPFSAFQDVSSFLDALYFHISGYADIPTYSYGTVWLLEDARTGRVLDNIGKEYCESKGRKRDSCLVSEAGVHAEMRLRVIRPRD